MSVLTRITWACPHCHGLHRAVREAPEACELARRLLEEERSDMVCLEDATAAALDDLDDAEQAAAILAPRAGGILAAFVRGLLRQGRP